MPVSRLYRHFKGKTGGPEAGARDDSTSTPSAPTPSQPPRPESTLRWRLTLLIALAIPVFLETLDYTGQKNVPGSVSVPSFYCFIVSSRCHRSIQHCGKLS